jgi:hypothetical protein
MAVIGIFNAIILPITPPIDRATTKYIKLLKKISTDKIETTIASIMPVIPKKFPILEVSGDESPLSAKIKSTPVIKNNIDDRLADII